MLEVKWAGDILPGQLLEVSDKTVLELGQGFGKETW